MTSCRHTVTWADQPPVGSNSQAYHLPPFQFNAPDVARGAVKVLAKSPSGRSQLMDLSESDGMYNANFTPDECGDWTVSILYEDADIQGSPFKVRVYDPGQIRVSGLEGGMVGRTFSFTVETSRAGEGMLTIDILYNGRTIPAQIISDPRNRHLFKVLFNPPGSGFYTIHVYFANIEVPGSPFTVEVVDPSSVSVSGPGLTQCQVQQKAFFIINAGHVSASASDFCIVITDPRGLQIPAKIQPNADGTLRVEYVPLVLGQHTIDVSYFGKPVCGSPFMCKVADHSRISVTNLCRITNVGRTVEFDIDASQAGHGDLEIMINEGTVPCSVQNRSNKRFHATFVPREPIPHRIHLRFNCHEVPGSPWVVDVQNADHVVVSGKGLHLVPVGMVTSFEVKTGSGSSDVDVTVNITSPSHRMIQSHVIPQLNGVYRVDYIPPEVGNYTIEVLYGCLLVPGSPFTGRAYNGSLITVSPVRPGCVGKSVEFMIDATQAGDGQIEITIDNGTVPNSAQMVSKGKFSVSFVPEEAKTYSVEIKFNGELIKRGPIMVPVYDVSQVKLQGDLARIVPVGRPVTVSINTQLAGDARLTAGVTSPSGKDVPCRINGGANKIYSLDFTPTEVGPYTVEVKYGDCSPVCFSPLHISAYDISKIKLHDVCDALICHETKLTVDMNGAGEGELEFCVTGPLGTLLPNQVRTIGNDSYSVVFVPVQCGQHQITATFNGLPISGSPVRFNVIDTSKATARGDGLGIVPCFQPTAFFVTAPGAQGKDFKISVTGPGSKDIATRVIDNGNGNIKVEYTPVIPGEYFIEVTYCGQQIPGSPFVSKAWDISKVIVSDLCPGRVGYESTFKISVKDAGEGTLEIGMLGPSGNNISNNVTNLGPGYYLVTCVPTENGMHRANVTFNGENVNGSPFQFMVNDPSKVTARGDGLGLVKCNQQTSFTVSAQGATTKDLDVLILGPGNKDISCRVTDSGSGNFKVDYTPTVAGDYIIEISCFCLPIPASPFTAKAWDVSKVVVSNVTAGRVGCQSMFNIDVKSAGDGTLEIAICGPSNQNISNNVSALGPGLFLVSYVPVESGQHRANVLFNKDNVFGNPFQFLVTDPSKASARGDGLGLIRCNQMTSFTVTAPGASTNDIDISIMGPGSKDVLPKITEIGSNVFKVDYTPNCPGDYGIDILYFGQPLPGSPFSPKVWDPAKVVVSQINQGRVGIPSSFFLDVNDAGEGTLEIGISGPSGQNIHNNVTPLGSGRFEVVCVPAESGQHRVNITFNRENVLGNPFQFFVTDVNRVVARGEGLGLVRCNQPASFNISAPGAQLKDIEVQITGPNDRDVTARVTEAGPNNFRVDYTPLVSGDYCMNIVYFGQSLPSCPIIAKGWDVSKVKVNHIALSYVGVQSNFSIDAKDAGDGALEITVCRPSGMPIPSNIIPNGLGTFDVTFIPIECGPHRANILYNKETVAGSPFSIMVTDPTKASVMGDGVGLVRCNQVATFCVLGPGASLRDIGVRITGPDNRDVPSRIYDSSADNFMVDYTPCKAGDYVIEVTYFEDPIGGSPFVSKAWDASLVLVSNVTNAVIGKPSHFNINAANAGMGNLEISISVRGETIPNIVKTMANTTFDVSFTPHVPDTHTVYVRFNGEMVTGSPFSVNVLDGTKAVASGEGLGRVLANVPTSFDVTTTAVGGDADLEVEITSPRGQQVPCRVSGSSKTKYRVDYTPVESGRYRVLVKYAEVGISGSPFCPEVFDPSQIRVGKFPQGILGKPFTFEVDTSMAGDGLLTAEVRGQITHPVAQVVAKSHGIYTVSFTATENTPHYISLLYSGAKVPGSPFTALFIDTSTLHVRWDSCRLRPVRQPVVLELDTKGAPDAEVSCKVTDPIGRDVMARITRSGMLYNIEFTPRDIGTYSIDIQYGGLQVPGCPFVCETYDIHCVRLLDLVNDGHIGKEVAFAVDTSKAGQGDLDVHVSCNNVRVPSQLQLLPDGSRYNCSFVPATAQQHSVHVTYNKEPVPGCPLPIQIKNPASQMSVASANGTKPIPVGQMIAAILTMHNCNINIVDIVASATGPNGERLFAGPVQQRDGTTKIEYFSQVAGTHRLEVQYAGQSISGSPIITEVFDPSKICVEGTRTGLVGEPVLFDIMRSGAGKADLALKILTLKGTTVPFNMNSSSDRDSVTYIPKEPGIHSIYVTCGGVDVPGCPVRQEILDNFLPNALGDGLLKGCANQVSTFYVDAKGHQGDLSVSVDGPNSLARCDIESVDSGGRYKVTYVPVEGGSFRAAVRWNGREINGSPFQVKVVNPERVEILGGWDSLIDASGRMKLKINEPKSFTIDASRAGPGQLTAQVIGPQGNSVLTDITSHGPCLFTLSFTPRAEGDYTLRVFYGDHLLQRCPIIGIVEKPPPLPVPVPVEPPCPPVQPSPPCPQVQPVIFIEEVVMPTPKPPQPPAPVQPPQPRGNPQSVQVIGPGLSDARVNEEAEFLLDGSAAGPGRPIIKMAGLKSDIDVQCIPIGNNRYRCTYIPEYSGAYLMSIGWGDGQVPGSPFKVTVAAGTDPCKVVFNGDSISTGIIGQILTSSIDISKAGPGQLRATCKGPSRPAGVKLVDQNNGTYSLAIKAQEAGCHVLAITYAGVPIPGSPFTIRITAAADASKVQVSGPGIQPGILATYQSVFNVDTRGAGPGQLSVRMRGRKGTFRVEMMKDPVRERFVVCRYNPTEVGLYIAEIKWAGQNIPGSPFKIQLFDTRQELEDFLSSSRTSYPSTDPFSGGALGNSDFTYGSLKNFSFSG